MQSDWNRAQTAARLLSTVVNRHDVVFHLAKLKTEYAKMLL